MNVGEARYEVNVTPVGFDGLTPTYEVMVYRFIKAGICGPFAGPVTVTGLDGVHDKVGDWGFLITSDFGPVCANGFATATAISATGTHRSMTSMLEETTTKEGT